MLEFFAILLIIYVLWRLFKPIIIRRAQEKYMNYVAEQARRAFEQQQRQASESGNPFFGSFSGFYGFGSDGSHPGSRTSASPRRKVFTRDMGEYVEFEELEGTFVSERNESDCHATESQISDAEWEEIR